MWTVHKVLLPHLIVSGSQPSDVVIGLSFVVACTSPLSKEGLWQNWMSTSGSAQLESESHIANTNDLYHHQSGAHCCHCGESAQVNDDRSKVCNYHDADVPSASTTDCSSTGYVSL